MDNNLKEGLKELLRRYEIKHINSNIHDERYYTKKEVKAFFDNGTTPEINSIKEGLSAEIERAKSAEKLLAPIDNPNFTGIPLAPTADFGTTTEQLATTEFVQLTMRRNKIVKLQGTIGSSGDVQSLPMEFDTGWAYRVIEDGVYSSYNCLEGDLLIAMVSRKEDDNHEDSDWFPIHSSSAERLLTPRMFTIGNSSKPFDGSGNVSWSLDEIGAASNMRTHSSEMVSVRTMEEGWYRIGEIPHPGLYGTEINLQIGRYNAPTPEMINLSLMKSGDASKYSLVVNRRIGDPTTSRLRVCYATDDPANSSVYIDIYSSTSNDTDATRLQFKIVNQFVTGVQNTSDYDDYFMVPSVADSATLAEVPAGYNSIEFSIDSSQLQINSAKIDQVYGNALTCTRLANARTLTIGNTGKTFDGSNNVSWTLSEIGAAAISHGNHVPSIETANNARFLRNDNTWQTITPANIGALPTTGKAASASVADSANSVAWGNITGKPSSFTPTSHSHNYAGSSSAGGAANSANWLNTSDGLVFGSSGLQYFNHNSSTSSGAASNTCPTTDWYHIIRMNHANSNGYYGEIATCFHSNAMYYRRVASGVDYGWVRLLDSSNYTSFCTPSNIGAAAASHSHDYIPTSASCNKNWNWSGQGGQPNWVWGGNDGTNMYVYNPSNFSVNYASSAGNADTLDGYHASSFASSSHSHSYLPLSGGTLSGVVTMNAALTFGGYTYEYGIFPGSDNYCSIGRSNRYFYRSYITNMYSNYISCTAGYNIAKYTASATDIVYSTTGATSVGNQVAISSNLTDLRLHGRYINLVHYGGIYANGTVWTYSDEKLKIFSDDMTEDAEKLIKLFDYIEPRSYRYRYTDENSQLCIGFSAQEIEGILEELELDPCKYNLLTIQYNCMIDRGSEEYDKKFYLKLYSIAYDALYTLALLKLKYMEKTHLERLSNIEKRLAILEGAVETDESDSIENIYKKSKRGFSNTRQDISISMDIVCIILEKTWA